MSAGQRSQSPAFCLHNEGFISKFSVKMNTPPVDLCVQSEWGWGGRVLAFPCCDWLISDYPFRCTLASLGSSLIVTK